MKRRILLLSVLSGWMLLPTQAKMFNPFEEAPLNGPVKEVIMSNPDKKKLNQANIRKRVLSFCKHGLNPTCRNMYTVVSI